MTADRSPPQGKNESTKSPSDSPLGIPADKYKDLPWYATEAIERLQKRIAELERRATAESSSTLIGWGEPCKGFFCGCGGCVAWAEKQKRVSSEILGDFDFTKAQAANLKVLGLTVAEISIMKTWFEGSKANQERTLLTFGKRLLIPVSKLHNT